MEACFIGGIASNNQVSLPEGPRDGATGHRPLHCLHPAAKPNQFSNLYLFPITLTYINTKYNFVNDLKHRGKYI
jgi:hypothetical protein